MEYSNTTSFHSTSTKNDEAFRGSQSSLADNQTAKSSLTTATTGNSATKTTSTKRADPMAERIAADMRVFNELAIQLREKCNLQATFDDRCAQVVSHATELFGVAPTWAAFYREILGCEGIIRTAFPDSPSMERYEQSDQHSKVLEMLTVLRSRDLPENDPTESQRMVTIRMPKSLYDVICEEANELKISVNKLCISRVMQRLDRSIIPKAIKKRRGRRPGNAGDLK